MKLKFATLAVLTLTLITFPNRTLANPARIHILYLGKVELKRIDWPEYKWKEAPVVLYSTDSFRANHGEEVKILCSDLSVREVPAHNPTVVEDVCPPTLQPQLRIRGSDVGRPRTIGCDNSSEIEENVARIRQQGLTGSAEALALAYFYLSNNLREQAIEALEEYSSASLTAFIADRNGTAIVDQLLGDLYWEEEQNLQALDSYLQAVHFALEVDDLAMQAAVYSKLGRSYLVLGETGKGIRWLKRASFAYRQLEGESSPQVQEIEERLGEYRLCS